MKTMKTTMMALTIGALGLASLPADEIRLEDCPPEVKATITENARNGMVDEVDHYSIEGKHIYIAEVDGPQGMDLKIYVGGDGKLVKISEDIRLEDAPEPVRSAILNLEGNVDDIDKETAGKTVTFHVEMNRVGKADLEVVISAEGGIISKTEEIDD